MFFIPQSKNDWLFSYSWQASHELSCHWPRGRPAQEQRFMTSFQCAEACVYFFQTHLYLGKVIRSSLSIQISSDCLGSSGAVSFGVRGHSTSQSEITLCLPTLTGSTEEYLKKRSHEGIWERWFCDYEIIIKRFVFLWYFKGRTKNC